MSDERDRLDRGADVIHLPSSMGYRANEYEAVMDENPVRPDHEPSLGGCKHWRVWIDQRARRVRCRECKVELDPYDVLWRLGSAREELIRESRALRMDIEHRKHELGQAEREGKNAKSRLRAVRKKLRQHGLDPYAIERGENKPHPAVVEDVLGDGVTF